jgi:hypothetical protein
VVAVLLSTLLLAAVLGAIVLGNPDEQVVEAVATQADVEAPVDPLTDPDGPGFERHLSRFALGEQIRADAQADEDAALAAAAEMAAQEAAAQAAADEQAAADAAAAERAAALEFAAALAEAEEPEAPAGPPAAPTPSPTPTPPAVQGDPFDAIAQCESGRNPQAYNPAGPWYGAFQFSQGTWNQYAGAAMQGDPRQYSYAQQKTVAQRLQAARGWAPWPHCARQLGLL